MPSEENQQSPGAFDETPPEYAVVEVFGHRRHAGRILEVERFGAKMLRIDVPETGDFADGFVSHFYGGAAIFSLTVTTLESVRRMNKPYEPPRAYIMAPDDDEDGEQPGL